MIGLVFTFLFASLLFSCSLLFSSRPLLFSSILVVSFLHSPSLSLLFSVLYRTNFSSSLLFSSSSLFIGYNSRGLEMGEPFFSFFCISYSVRVCIIIWTRIISQYRRHFLVITSSHQEKRKAEEEEEEEDRKTKKIASPLLIFLMI